MKPWWSHKVIYQLHHTVLNVIHCVVGRVVDSTDVYLHVLTKVLSFGHTDMTVRLFLL